MKKLLFLFALMLLGASAFGQQDPHFTMYMFNKQVLNPAYVGSRPGTHFNGLARTQWVGMKNAPKTINVGGHGLLPSNRVGVGMFVMNDVIGVTQHTGAYAQYAYNVPLENSIVLSLGLQAGITRFHADLTDLHQPLWAYPAGDVILANDIQSAWLPNFGCGAFLAGPRFYLSASIPHLISNTYDRASDIIGSAKQYKHYFVMGGVRLPASEKIEFQPQLILKMVSGANLQVPFDADFDIGVIFNDMIMFGMAYRLSDSFDAYMRAQLTRYLSVGYAYDLTVSDLNAYNSGSHELLISWEIKPNVVKVVGPRLWTF